MIIYTVFSDTTIHRDVPRMPLNSLSLLYHHHHRHPVTITTTRTVPVLFSALDLKQTGTFPVRQGWAVDIIVLDAWLHLFPNIRLKSLVEAVEAALAKAPGNSP